MRHGTVRRDTTWCRAVVRTILLRQLSNRYLLLATESQQSLPCRDGYILSVLSLSLWSLPPQSCLLWNSANPRLGDNVGRPPWMYHQHTTMGSQLPITAPSHTGLLLPKHLVIASIDRWRKIIIDTSSITFLLKYRRSC